jgi:glutamate-1-semialdehyde 2,1-aminomutase
MGVVIPEDGFLEGLREITQKYDSLLIFDEVITGFRVSPGGAQLLFGIMPDLTCLGKIIGGGLPVGAYGGRRDLMEQVAPQGPIYQAGTLSGNPLAMAAGIATLKALQKASTYRELDEKGEILFEGILKAASSAGVDAVVNRIGSMGTIFFTGKAVTDFASAKASDSERFRRFYASMLQQGVYLAPSAFECWFLSTAHDEESLRHTIECARNSFASL